MSELTRKNEKIHFPSCSMVRCVPFYAHHARAKSAVLNRRKGNRVSVTVSIEEWHEIINEMQELEMLRSLKKQEEEKKKSEYPNDDPGALFG